ncbi:MAG: hypothetical protein INR71_08110 [Terriglobus roseus]|nr:hypothetical protein [Terriglobus roseus]
MASEHVVRVRRVDADDAFVLLKVTRAGSQPLDVRIVGTEGASPYVATSQ